MKKSKIARILIVMMIFTFSGFSAAAAEDNVLNFGIAHAMPLTFLDSGLTNLGAGLSAGIMNSLDDFFHYGADVSIIFSPGNDEDYNLVKYALFLPVTVEGGLNIRVSDFMIFQPFAGAGLSFEILGTEDDDYYFAGQPLRDESEKIHLYLDPCFILGMRFPLIKIKYNITPFVMAYGIPGKDSGGDLVISSLLVTGIRISLQGASK